MNASIENQSLELALFFLFLFFFFFFLLFNIFFLHICSFDLVIRTKTIHTRMNTAWKSSRAVEKLKFWVNGTVSRKKDPLVKQKKENCPFFCRSALRKHPLAIYRVKRKKKSLPWHLMLHQNHLNTQRKPSCIYCYINSLLRKHKILFNL